MMSLLYKFTMELQVIIEKGVNADYTVKRFEVKGMDLVDGILFVNYYDAVLGVFGCFEISF